MQNSDFFVLVPYIVLLVTCCNIWTQVPAIHVCWINLIHQSLNSGMFFDITSLELLLLLTSLLSEEALKLLMSCILAFLFLPVLCHWFSAFQCLPGQLGPFTHFISCSHVPQSTWRPPSSSTPSCPQSYPSAPTTRLPRAEEKVPWCQSLLCRITSLTEWDSQGRSVFLQSGPGWISAAPTFPRAPNTTITPRLPADVLQPNEGGEEWCPSTFFPSTLQVLSFYSCSPLTSSYQDPCWNISLSDSLPHWLSHLLSEPRFPVWVHFPQLLSWNALFSLHLLKKFLSHEYCSPSGSHVTSLPFLLQTSPRYSPHLLLSWCLLFTLWPLESDLWSDPSIEISPCDITVMPWLSTPVASSPWLVLLDLFNIWWC